MSHQKVAAILPERPTSPCDAEIVERYHFPLSSLMASLHGDEANLIGLNDRYKETETFQGRRYSKYSLEHEISLVPIDEEEIERQEKQHNILKELFPQWPDHRLYPGFVGEPAAILDCGFGTADWAIDAAMQNPESSVRAVDIVPHMPLDDWPENLELQVANLNERTSFPSEAFDFVHARFLAGGIGRFKWPILLTDAHRILREGGWVQVVEWDLNFRSNNGRSDRLQALREWTRLYHLALGATGFPEGKKSTSMTRDCEDWLRTARFRDLRVDVQEVPTCGWPQNPRFRGVGEQMLDVLREMLGSIAMYPVVARGICSYTEFQSVVSAAKQELGQPAAQPFLKLYTFWGKKDTSDEGADNAIQRSGT